MIANMRSYFYFFLTMSYMYEANHMKIAYTNIHKLHLTYCFLDAMFYHCNMQSIDGRCQIFLP